jgi:hypothetical protein
MSVIVWWVLGLFVITKFLLDRDLLDIVEIQFFFLVHEVARIKNV